MGVTPPKRAVADVAARMRDPWMLWLFRMCDDVRLALGTISKLSAESLSQLNTIFEDPDDLRLVAFSLRLMYFISSSRIQETVTYHGTTPTHHNGENRTELCWPKWHKIKPVMIDVLRRETKAFCEFLSVV